MRKNCVINVYDAQHESPISVIDTNLQKSEILNQGASQIVATKLSEDEYRDQFSEWLEQYLTSLNPSQSRMLSGTKYKSLIQKTFLAPNYNEASLRAEFQDQEWGLIPDNILVVENKSGISNEDNAIFSRMIISEKNGEELYIVPRENIKSFAYFTKLRQVITNIGKVDDNGNPVVKLPEFLETLNIDTLQSSLTEKVVEDFESIEDIRIKVLADKKAKIEKLEKQNAKLQDTINKNNAAIHKKGTKDSKNLERKEQNKEYEQEIIDNKEEIEDLESAIAQYEEFKKIQNLSDRSPQKLKERALTSLNQFDSGLIRKIQNKYKDNDLNRALPAYNAPDSASMLANSKTAEPELLNLSQFLNHFLTHSKEWRATLPTSMFFEIKNSLYELLGWNFNYNENDKVVKTIDSLIASYPVHNKTIDVPIKELGKYLKEELGETQNLKYQVIKDWLFKNYIGRGNGFNLKINYDEKTKTVTFTKKYKSIGELLDLTGNSMVLPEPLEQYNGIYTYKVRIGDEDAFFYTYFPYFPGIKPKRFSSESEMIQHLNESFDNKRLDLVGAFIKTNKGTIVSDSDSKEHSDGIDIDQDTDLVRSIPHSKFIFKEGQKVEVLNLSYGNVKIPASFTVLQFKHWIESTFNTQNSQKILEKVNTLQKMAYFYSVAGKITPESFNYESHNYDINHFNYNGEFISLNTLLSKIDEAQLIQYDVVEDTDYKSINGRTYCTTKFVKHFDTNAPSNQKIEDTKSPRVIQLESIKAAFEKAGVKIVIVNNAEMKKITGVRTSVAPSGYHIGGIIYLNNESEENANKVATHELSHLFLALLRARDEQYNSSFYKDILNRCYDIFNSINKEATLKLKKDIEKTYSEKTKDLSNEEIDLYVKEEMFATIFGEYMGNTIDNNSEALSRLFVDSVQQVSKSTIFDNTEDASTIFNEMLKAKQAPELFEQLSSQVREAKSNLGFGLNLIPQLHNQAESFIEKQIKDNVIEEKCL